MARRKVHTLICKNSNCGQQFMGQRGQLYCSQDCKNDVGNEKKRQDPDGLLKINKILHRNYKVLEEAYDPADPDKVFQIKYLQLKGLNTKYYTQLEQREQNLYCYWVYSYCFIGYSGGIKISKS